MQQHMSRHRAQYKEDNDIYRRRIEHDVLSVLPKNLAVSGLVSGVAVEWGCEARKVSGARDAHLEEDVLCGAGCLSLFVGRERWRDEGSAQFGEMGWAIRGLKGEVGS